VPEAITLPIEMSSLPILPGTSDERLLELVMDGEERAFEIVVMRYRASLVGYCTRLGLSETRAEDAVQQCFLSALLALRRGDIVRDLRAWLGRIAHNVAVNMMRAGSAHRETAMGKDWAAEDRAIHIPDMDGGLAAREALAEVAALPPMQREALLQSALGGRTYGEVAASMGVSEGAVRGLLHRARASLRNAAAIFSPFPLMKRVSSWLGGASPSAGRVLELTAPGGGSGLSSTAVRTLGAGLTAVVVTAAGVAVAPGGRSHSRSGTSAKGAVASTHRHLGGVPATLNASSAPASTPVLSGTPGGASSNAGLKESPGGVGGRTGQAPPSTPTQRRAASHASPAPTESQLPSSTSVSGPAQVSSVSPTPAGTVTPPSSPPSEQAGEVKKPRKGEQDPRGEGTEPHEKPGESDDAREAEEKATGSETETGTKVKDN
jgi:RNA polymerase sigma factor (sigma-70 family)